ncbi:MocR-like pyridoxine biosynthesis transcription factor PdxR [Paraburkholderia acidicola]|nr:PLP-dependent aminotransferase family protein [Paraburkholderia acidicola]
MEPEPTAAGSSSMPSSPFEFPLELPSRDSRNLLRELHRQLRTAILDGRLKPGLRLPATRAFAEACGVSRNTAIAAYDLLLSEGYLVTRRKAGTYVAEVLPQPAARAPVSAQPRPQSVRQGDPRLNAYWRTAPAPYVPMPAPAPRDFQFGVPEKQFFRFDIWQRLSSRATRALAKAPAIYSDAQGRTALREAIAAHVAFARAVACRADDVIVTAGAQQAFDLLARILVTPGRTTVAVEDPGYPPMRAAFALAGARVVPVPVDEEGLIVDRLPADARIVCVTPSHQFPLGTAMSMRRRTALLEFAQTHGAVIIEDDYDGEFRLGARPLDALQTLDRTASVFYVGTFSKSLFPALRLGYVVAPAWAQGPLISLRQHAEWHPAVLPQDTLAAFIAEGHLARHVRKMREIYGMRRRVLLECLQRDFSGSLEPIASDAGLHLAAFAKVEQHEIERMLKRVRDKGVRFESLGAYYAGSNARSGIGFGYGGVDEAGIREGLAILRDVWRAG